MKIEKHTMGKNSLDSFYHRRLTLLDVCSILLTFGVSIIALLIFTFTGNSSASTVEIKTAQDTFYYALTGDRILQLQGPLGITEVQIANQYVDVLDSPGRQKICVHAEPISKSGEWLACLPNRVFIMIVGGAEQTTSDAVDAIIF